MAVQSVQSGDQVKSKASHSKAVLKERARAHAEACARVPNNNLTKEHKVNQESKLYFKKHDTLFKSP